MNFFRKIIFWTFVLSFLLVMIGVSILFAIKNNHFVAIDLFFFERFSEIPLWGIVFLSMTLGTFFSLQFFAFLLFGIDFNSRFLKKENRRLNKSIEQVEEELATLKEQIRNDARTEDSFHAPSVTNGTDFPENYDESPEEKSEEL